jgi:hypothetical protein
VSGAAANVIAAAARAPVVGGEDPVDVVPDGAGAELDAASGGDVGLLGAAVETDARRSGASRVPHATKPRTSVAAAIVLSTDA